MKKSRVTCLPSVRVSMSILTGLGIALCLLSSAIAPTTDAVKKTDGPPPITLKVAKVAENLQAPTALAFPGNGDIWVTEQTGNILVIRQGKLLDRPLLDLHSKLIRLDASYDERGVLGIALSPGFASNKKFYVFYSAPSLQSSSDHKGVLAEYTLSAASGLADPNSGQILFTIEEPESNHNGGCITFGPDGYLYLTFGDGGGQGDHHGETGNGQKMDTWLGKILRIDVNTKSGYLVPKDNPFVGQKNKKPEIWAYGFRNPYRISFDRASGQLFAGDVGQDLWEEVDLVTRGANYGWRLTEGTHCYNPATGCPLTGITMPITEYSHKEGISVIGGYIYNGQELPALKSKYLFADWSGPVFYLQKAGAAWQRGKVVLQNLPPYSKITAFGEDAAGELYVLTNLDNGPGNKKGSVYKIVRN